MGQGGTVKCKTLLCCFICSSNYKPMCAGGRGGGGRLRKSQRLNMLPFPDKHLIIVTIAITLDSDIGN